MSLLTYNIEYNIHKVNEHNVTKHLNTSQKKSATIKGHLTGTGILIFKLHGKGFDADSIHEITVTVDFTHVLFSVKLLIMQN